MSADSDFASLQAADGRHSPNLRAWLIEWRARHKNTSHASPGVFQDAHGELWVGYLCDSDGSLIGCRLISVLCNGVRERTVNHVGMVNPTLVADFWVRYARVGRCAVDPDHSMSFIGDESRWSRSGDRRVCNWCGQVAQVLRRWTETINREQWENAGHPNGGPASKSESNKGAAWPTS